MRTNLIITDNFYNNPDDVRNFALSLDFTVQGNYPGLRTKSYLNDSLKEKIQEIVGPFSGKVTQWNDQDGLTGSFELATSRNRSWLHTDHFNTWAGIIYLTPNAPVTGGTGLFKYKQTGSMLHDGTDYSNYTQDMTKWELVDQIGNVYNRFALYRSDIYHTSLDYFGFDKLDGRLFQLFFITTEF